MALYPVTARVGWSRQLMLSVTTLAALVPFVVPALVQAQPSLVPLSQMNHTAWTYADRPDLTLMDLSMPGIGGVAAIQASIAEQPTARIIALTTYDGDADIHRALQAGARGYLLKDSLRNHVAEAFRTVHRGARVIPPAIAGRLAEFSPRIELTARELEVLGLLAKGMSNKEIATVIGRTEATVKVRHPRA